MKRAATVILFLTLVLSSASLLFDAAASSQAVDGPSAGSSDWQRTDMYQGNPTISENGTVYAPVLRSLGENGSLLFSISAISPNGTEMWVCPIGTSSFSEIVIGMDGIVYVTYYHSLSSYPWGSSEYPFLLAIGYDGNVLWKFNASSDIPGPSKVRSLGPPVIAPDGSILFTVNDPGSMGSGSVSSAEHFIVCSVDRNGSLRWSAQVNGGNGNIIVGEGLDYHIWVVTETGVISNIYANGTLNWSENFDADRFHFEPMALIGQDGSLFIIVSDSNPCSYNGSEIWNIQTDGQVKWRFDPFGYPIYHGTLKLIGSSTDGRSYFVNNCGIRMTSFDQSDATVDNKVGDGNVASALTALYPNGTVDWSLTFDGPLLWLSSFTDHNIYLMTEDGIDAYQLHIIDPNGKEVEQRSVQGSNYDYLAISGDGSFYYYQTSDQVNKGWTLVASHQLPGVPSRPMLDGMPYNVLVMCAFSAVSVGMVLAVNLWVRRVSQRR